MKNDPMFYVGIALLFLFAFSRPGIRHRFLRGNRLTPAFWLWFKLRRWRNASDVIVWGRRRFPVEIARQSFLVAGTIGSGKTLIIRLLLQNEMSKNDGSRYLIYDGKGDMLDIVIGMKRSDKRVITFDPFIVEGARWAIWLDVVDPASCNQVTRILFPKGDHEHQPFFSESVQNIVSALMQTFIELKIMEWRLSHLLFILRSADRIQQVLRLTQRGKDVISDFTQAGETWANIMATISNRINDYEILASLWDHAKTEYSLREWSKKDDILVLRKNSQNNSVVDCMNRVLFAMAKRYLLIKPEGTQERSWVVLDELASFGGRAVSQELSLLLEQGRSRNVACVLGFHNIAALRDEFGALGADRIIALCSTKALLRVEDHASAEWAAGFFGEQEVRVRSTSHSWDWSSSTTSYDNKNRAVVMASEFQAIPLTCRKFGLMGYFTAPVASPPLAYRDRIRGKWLFSEGNLSDAKHVEREGRTDEQQRLAITQEDIDRLFGGHLQLASAQKTTSNTGRAEAHQPLTSRRPAEQQPAPQQSALAASSKRSPEQPGDKATQEPVEVWNIADGTVEPIPSIWNVPRQ